MPSSIPVSASIKDNMEITSTSTAPSPETLRTVQSRTPLQNAMRRFFRHRSAQFGLIILGFMIFIALTSPVLAPYSPIKVLTDVKPRSDPCIHALGCPEDQPQHIFGVDGNRRDLLSRVMYGARLSLLIGIATVSFAILIGTILGAIAGYAGGWTDTAIMPFMDILLAFPGLLLSIAIVAVLGPGLMNALLAIAFVSIPVYARIVRSSVLQVKEQDLSRLRGHWAPRLLGSWAVTFCRTPLPLSLCREPWESGLSFWMQRPFPSWVLAQLLRRQNGG